MKDLRSICAFLVAIAVLSTTLIDSISRSRDLENLVSRNTLVEASITGSDCRDHSRVYFVFEDAGRKISGSTTDLVAKQCEDYQLGEKINVFFDPKNPDINSVLSPTVAYDRALEVSRFRTFVTVLVVIIAVIRFAWRFLEGESPSFL